MTSLEIAGLVAIILMSAFAVTAIIVAIPLYRLLNRVRSMADELSGSLIPMVEKLNDTVDHLNNEVGSISDLTQSVSSIVEQLEKVIRLARVLVTSPIVKLISASAGIIGGMKETARDEDD